MQFEITNICFVLFGQLTQKDGVHQHQNSSLFNCKELEDAPYIIGNGLTRTIFLWWVYVKILGLIPLNYSICTGHQDSTHKGVKDHVSLCISSKVKGFNGHHQRNEGYDGVHINILHINKEEGSTIYSSYQGYQGTQHHQSSGNKDFFKNIVIIFKVFVSLKTYPMVPLYIFITIRVPTP